MKLLTYEPRCRRRDPQSYLEMRKDFEKQEQAIRDAWRIPPGAFSVKPRNDDVFAESYRWAKDFEKAVMEASLNVTIGAGADKLLVPYRE